MITETRAKLEMLMDMWNDLRELESKVSKLYVYIYHKELLRQKEKEEAEERELIGDCNNCRFAGCSECDDCINGSQWVRMTREDEE